MLRVTIKSYGEHFDTYEIEILESVSNGITRSLIAAVMLPYVAVGLVETCENLPYDAVGHRFTMVSRLVDVV